MRLEPATPRPSQTSTTEPPCFKHINCLAGKVEVGHTPHTPLFSVEKIKVAIINVFMNS